MKHALFVSRTVLVHDNNFQEAAKILNRIMAKEGLIKDAKLIQNYEKPWQTRRRVNFEHCKAIYNEDQNRRLNFLMRKHRTEPYPGCY